MNYELAERMLLSSVPLTKGGIEEAALSIWEIVDGGNLSAIAAAAKLNAIKQICEAGLESIRGEVLAEVALHGKEATYSGVKIELAEVGVKYNYSHSQEWQALAVSEAKIAEQRKAVEAELKTIPAGKQITAPNGRILVGPSKTSTSSFKVTIPKNESHEQFPGQVSGNAGLASEIF